MERFARLKRGRWRNAPVQNLSHTEFETLMAAHRLGAGNGVRPGALADFFQVAPPTLNRTTRRLESLGLLVSVPDPADGRAVLLRLSERGERLREEAHKQFLSFFERVSERLGEEKSLRLIELLDEVHACAAEERRSMPCCREHGGCGT